MSAQGAINIVDDDEMSSEGSVNTPVVPQHQGAVAQAPTQQIPSRLPQWPNPRRTAATQQSGVVGPSGSVAPTIPVQSTEVIATATVPIDAPSREETRQAFDEVSSALHSVSSAHEEVKACWRRFFWRWALSPLRFGSFRKLVARSTMMLHGRCIPRHEYPTRQVRDINTYNRPRLLSEGQAAVWARFDVQNTAPPPRQMRAFTITRLAVHERREWITMSFPVTVYISPGQLSRQNCPATTERV